MSGIALRKLINDPDGGVSNPTAAAACELAPKTAAAPGVIGTPVVFDRFSGFFHAGSRDARLAVVLMSPFGYEELCTRTAWRLLAEMLAAAGLPCIRFDYPGTADALDPIGAADGLKDWRTAACDAARHLKRVSGCSRVMLLGQGVGASLAAEGAKEIDDVVGTALLGPVVSGRSHLRELKAWAKVMADGVGIAAETDGYTVAGIPLAAERAEGIRALELMRLSESPSHVLLVSRPRAPAPRAFADRLRQLGSAVTDLTYEGYDRLLSDPTQGGPPLETLSAVVDWAVTLAANQPPPASIRSVPETEDTGPIALSGDGFDDVPMRFDEGRLFGVFCCPTVLMSQHIVVFVNAGRDYHAGWGRATVAQARALAQAGAASFRFDIPGVGDSPSDPAGPAEILYTTAHVAAVTAAIDHVGQLGFAEVTLFGRCSGAYAAFHAATDDARVKALMLVNIARFVWTPGESVAEAMKFAQRNIADLGATLLWRGGVRRLFSGELRVRAASAFVVRRLAVKLGRKLALLPGGLTLQSRLYHDVHRRFRLLRERGTRMALVYASNDTSRAELRSFMGGREQRLRTYPNTAVIEIPESDHNFTQRSAREQLTERLIEMLAIGAS